MNNVKEKYLLNITTTNLNVEKTHDFTFKTSFLQLSTEKTYECALLSYSLWYSWYNIKTGINDKFRYVVSGVVKDITIPAGQWGVSDINSYIQSQLVVNGDSATGVSIVGNYNLLRVVITLEPNYDVDFTIAQSFRGLLGFNSQLYENNGVTDLEFVGESAANISGNVDAVSINCSILNPSYNITNNQTSTSLHSFVPQSGPGTNLAQTIPTPIYLPISSSGNIHSFNIRISDQAQNELDLNGENISLSLLIKEV